MKKIILYCFVAILTAFSFVKTHKVNSNVEFNLKNAFALNWSDIENLDEGDYYVDDDGNFQDGERPLSGITCSLCGLDIDVCSCDDIGSLNCNGGGNGNCYDESAVIEYCWPCQTFYSVLDCEATGSDGDYCGYPDMNTGCPLCDPMG